MKKHSILKLITAAFISSTLLLACDKDDNVTPTPDKVKKLMHDWKITNITTTKKNEPTVDSTLLKTCMSDDLIKFNAEGYDFQDGATKCDSAVFHYAKGVWAYNLATDSIQLGATTPAKYVSWKVLKLNDSVLEVKYIDSLNAGSKVTKTLSFKH